jgi:hypothetical protein
MSERSPGDTDPEEPEPEPALRELDPDLPEADVIEQHQAVEQDGLAEAPSSFPAEVPEADAIEQATPAPGQDEDPDS